MESIGDKLKLSASDLTGHFACRHLTNLDFEVAIGVLEKPGVWDPFLELLRERARRCAAYAPWATNGAGPRRARAP